MTLLLDTHAFIWWDGEPGRLSARALALCQDPFDRMIAAQARVEGFRLVTHDAIMAEYDVQAMW